MELSFEGKGSSGGFIRMNDNGENLENENNINIDDLGDGVQMELPFLESKIAPLIPSVEDIFKKSNYLIGAYYTARTWEERVMNLGLYFLKESEIPEPGKNIVVRIHSSDIKRLCGLSKVPYNSIKDACNRLTQKNIELEVDDEHGFDYMSVITRARFEKSWLTITYNGDLRDVLLESSKKYTRLNIKIMLRIGERSAIRLYELLTKDAYAKMPNVTQKQSISAKSYQVTLNLIQFLLLVGGIETTKESVKRLTKKKTNINFDELRERLDKSGEYKIDWTNIRRKKLEPAIESINKFSDIQVTWEPDRGGRGGKVRGITFTVTPREMQPDGVTPKKIVDGKVVEIPDPGCYADEDIEKVRELFKPKISRNSAIKILNAAEGKMETVEKAYIYITSMKKVRNGVVYMIDCLKKKYYEDAASKIKESKKQSSSNFQEREYDYDELEKKFSKN